jgi:hypothetical protein
MKSFRSELWFEAPKRRKASNAGAPGPLRRLPPRRERGWLVA